MVYFVQFKVYKFYINNCDYNDNYGGWVKQKLKRMIIEVWWYICGNVMPY